MSVWRQDDKMCTVNHRGIYKGMKAFLCGCGPSLNDIPPNLQGPNRIIAAMNTAYPKVRPDIWIGMDDPQCYDSRILLEPFPKYYRGGYQHRQALGKPLQDHPSTFFLDCAKGGSVREAFTRTGEDDHFIWTKNTMAIAIHFLMWAGVSEINLVGCDMGGQEDYWHGNKLTGAQRKINKQLYKEQVQMIRQFYTEGKRYDVSFISCTKDSPLNGFLPYEDLEAKIEALNGCRNKHTQEHAIVIEDRMKNKTTDDERPVILHYNNWAILGGVETTVVDISKELSSYRHVLCTRNNRHADPTFINWLESIGIEHCFGTIEDAADKYKPKAIFMHNTTDHIYSGRWKCPIVAAHHCYQESPGHFDMHWCVSDYVRRFFKQQDGLWIVSPPPVTAAPFLAVERPERTPVVGRIQSSTGWQQKSTPLFYDTLRKLDRCGLYVVGHGVPEDLSGGPIQAGKMPELLSNIDIMAIWGDTTETWSKVVTEANLSGIPVVARYHNDGQSEQLAKSGGGILVGSINGFRENIQYLVDNPQERIAMGAQGREWCLQNATTKQFRHRVWDRLMYEGQDGIRGA